MHMQCAKTQNSPKIECGIIDFGEVAKVSYGSSVLGNVTIHELAYVLLGTLAKRC